MENVRESLVTHGLEITLAGKPKKPRGKILSAEQEAKIIALRLGQPPKGFSHWSLRLLAEKAVALEIAESISYETVRRTLKKNEFTQRRIEYWVIAPHPGGLGRRSGAILTNPLRLSKKGHFGLRQFEYAHEGIFLRGIFSQKAKSILQRLEFCHTPKHGSWLNIAENELSCMTRQCITGRRFATTELLQDEITPWLQHLNHRQREVDW